MPTSLAFEKVEKIYIYPDEESEQDITTIEIKIFNFSQIDHTQSAYDKIFKQFFLDEIKNPISTKCRVESGTIESFFQHISFQKLSL